VAFSDFSALITGFTDLNNSHKLSTILSHELLARPAAKYCQDVLERRRILIYTE
jgi:hypothetical protein